MSLKSHSAFWCPLCCQPVSVDVAFQHLREHGITVVFKGRLVQRVYAGGTVYEYGKPFWEIGRALIPEAKYDTERVYNAELRGYVQDEAGNPALIANPSVCAYDIIRELRINGLDAQYIRIEGANILTQARGSPVPWYVKLLIVAVAFAIFVYFGSTAFKLVVETLYRIFVAPIPPEWRPYIFAAVLGIVGLVAVAYAVPRLRGRG